MKILDKKTLTKTIPKKIPQRQTVLSMLIKIKFNKNWRNTH